MFEIAHALSSHLSNDVTLFIGLSIIFGLIIGSFLNVVIYRMPKILTRQWQQNCLALQCKEMPDQAPLTLATPRSACPTCNHTITAIENIPVISYLFLGGKCKSCKTRISIRYPLVEILTGALLGLVAYQFGYTYTTLFAWIFILALITLSLIDFDTQLLPDDITLPLLWLGLLFNLNNGFTDLKSAVIGAAIGAWFGWQLLPAVVLLSAVLGAIIGIGLMWLKGKSSQTAISFGPFLALGGIAALFFGQHLAGLY